MHLKNNPVATHKISRRSLLVGTAGLTVAAIGSGRIAVAQDTTGQTISSANAEGQTHEVQMLNRSSEGRPMQFEPAFLRIAPGDTVTFVPTDKGHNSESILNLIPEGADTWKGKINEEISITFEQEGLFAYKCQPHLGLGMVGLIQVGQNTSELNTEEVEKLPPRARERMAELIAEASAPAADAESAPAAQ